MIPADLTPYGRTFTLKRRDHAEALLIVHLGPMMLTEGVELIMKLRRSRSFAKTLIQGLPAIDAVQRVIKKRYHIGSRPLWSDFYFKRTALEAPEEEPRGHCEIHELLWEARSKSLPKSFARYMSYRYGDSRTQWAVPTERETNSYILTRKHHGYRSYDKAKLQTLHKPLERAPIPFGAYVNPRPELALVVKTEGKTTDMNLAIIKGKRYIFGNSETFDLRNEKAILKP